VAPDGRLDRLQPVTVVAALNVLRERA